MYRGRRDFKMFRLGKNLSLSLSLLLSFALISNAQAFGFFGKGTLNIYWLGGLDVYRSGFTTGQGLSNSGTGDGAMANPSSVSIDASGNVIVLDSYNSRIEKFNSSGVFQGWIGKIVTSPTGGAAGCNGAAAGTFTPGWCTGGTGHWGPDYVGTGDGTLGVTNNAGLTTDSSGNIYVASDNDDRIIKYNSSGVFQGWIGKISSSPTGGAAGCNGAAVGTATPGWCTGGAGGAVGSGNGMLKHPTGVVVDGSGNIYVVDGNNYRISKYNSAGAFQGWIGKIATSPTGGAAGCNGATVGTATPGWCTGGTAGTGSGNGMFSNPVNVALDSSGNIFVTDGARIQKFNSSGVFQGWIGNIAISPTGGDAGCNGAAVGTFTPGWCTGGGAGSGGTGDGLVNVFFGIAIDASNNIYAGDSSANRILKYNSSGVFQGWVGKIATSPTGGASGCSGATVGTLTPGLCTGGSSTAGTADGMLNMSGGLAVDGSGSFYVANISNSRIDKFTSAGVLAGALQMTANYQSSWWNSGGDYGQGNGDGLLRGNYGVTTDSAGNIYVADSGNDRISKYTAAGVFIGWIGKIGSVSPTGGAAGCSSAALGTFTPGWCTGGISDYGAGDGMMDWPARVVLDASGNLYVLDQNNSRINKYNSSGSFIGWIGNIATSPTGGAAGCNGAAAGTLTPGWCTGGTSTSGSGDGMLSTASYGLALDSSGNIYVVDTYNDRINKYDSLGAFVGWIGNIDISPTGGAAGCNGAAVGTFTPGWCKGGAARGGNSNGMLSQAEDMVFDSAGNFYVVDTNNTRINKYSSAGAPLGWIGTVGSVSPTGGAAGCTTTPQYSFTPGWCTGGNTDYGWYQGDGSMGWPEGITLDQQGYMYVADGSQINKYKLSTGAFVGWIGWINTSPTGGATGCKNAAVGSYTPGWCKGGDPSWEGYVGLSVTSKGDLLSANGSGIITRISTHGR